VVQQRSQYDYIERIVQRGQSLKYKSMVSYWSSLSAIPAWSRRIIEWRTCRYKYVTRCLVDPFVKSLWKQRKLQTVFQENATATVNNRTSLSRSRCRLFWYSLLFAAGDASQIEAVEEMANTSSTRALSFGRRQATTRRTMQNDSNSGW